jgi:hypothetical protein
LEHKVVGKEEHHKADDDVEQVKPNVQKHLFPRGKIQERFFPIIRLEYALVVKVDAKQRNCV